MNQLIADALLGVKEQWQSEVESLNKKIFSNPPEAFFAVQKEFKELLESGENRFTKEFDKKIEELSTRERRAKKEMSNYCNTQQNNKMIERVALLNVAITDINNMLYYHNRG